MPRSSDNGLIFKDPKPTRRPSMFGRIPSMSGGHMVDVAFGTNPDGSMVAEQIGDNGLVSMQADPFSYLALFGDSMTMTPSDMQEFLAGVQEGRQEALRKNPRPVITQKELKQKVADLIAAVADARVARKKFGWHSEKLW